MTYSSVYLSFFVSSSPSAIILGHCLLCRVGRWLALNSLLFCFLPTFFWCQSLWRCQRWAPSLKSAASLGLGCTLAHNCNADCSRMHTVGPLFYCSHNCWASNFLSLSLSILNCQVRTYQPLACLLRVTADTGKGSSLKMLTHY